LIFYTEPNAADIMNYMITTLMLSGNKNIKIEKEWVSSPDLAGYPFLLFSHN